MHFSSAMLGVLAKYFKDIAVLRQLLLAVVFLSPELPMFWTVLVFATEGRIQQCSVTPEQVQALVENIEALNATAFQTDEVLPRELIYQTVSGKKPLGLPLISPVSTCVLCGGHEKITMLQ